MLHFFLGEWFILIPDQVEMWTCFAVEMYVYVCIICWWMCTYTCVWYIYIYIYIFRYVHRLVCVHTHPTWLKLLKHIQSMRLFMSKSTLVWAPLGCLIKHMNDDWHRQPRMAMGNPMSLINFMMEISAISSPAGLLQAITVKWPPVTFHETAQFNFYNFCHCTHFISTSLPPLATFFLPGCFTFYLNCRSSCVIVQTICRPQQNPQTKKQTNSPFSIWKQRLNK